MSKERLLKILHEFHEDNNWLCYEYVEDFGGFFLYENSYKVAEFFLDDYDLLMTCGINTSTQIEKVIRVAIAKYIVQEEELRNKKYKYKVPEFLCMDDWDTLNMSIKTSTFTIHYDINSSGYQSHFTDSEIEDLIEKHGEDFKAFIEMCEKVEVE